MVNMLLCEVTWFFFLLHSVNLNWRVNGGGVMTAQWFNSLTLCMDFACFPTVSLGFYYGLWLFPAILKMQD